MTAKSASEVEPATTVIFRVWINSADVLALFPEEAATVYGDTCFSYMHVGQHAAADYHACVTRTRPALPEEYAPLKRELEQIGYRLKVVKKATPAMHQKRRATAEQYRKGAP